MTNSKTVIALIVLLSGMLTACESLSEKIDTNRNEMPSPYTFAFRELLQGNEIESPIKNLDIAIFRKESEREEYYFDKLIRSAVLESHAGTILTTIDTRPAVSHLFFFIANGEKLHYASLLIQGVTTPAQLKQFLFSTNDLPNNNTHIMTGTSETSGIAPSYRSPIPTLLERRVARIDFINTLKGFNITAITLHNICDRASLGGGEEAWYDTLPQSSFSMHIPPNTPLPSMYPFPSPNTNNIQLLIEGNYQGRRISLTSPFACESGSMDILANTVYNVRISDTRIRALNNGVPTIQILNKNIHQQ